MGANVYGILNGYQGMVDNKIKQLLWGSVSSVLHEVCINFLLYIFKGGTFIGTARCAAFTTREGRKTAVRNLLENGIDRYVLYSMNY